MTLAPIIHALYVAADKLELVADELPSIATEHEVLLNALARAAQLTAEQLRDEQAELERKLERV